MSPTDEIPGTLTRHDWQIIMAGLGELKGAVMYETAKKVEALVTAPAANSADV